MMTQTETKTAIEALRQAIQAEGDGYHFYMMAARSTQDPKGCALLEVLAQEELGHLHHLRAHHQALLEHGTLARQARLGPRQELSGPSPIFSPELRGRLNQAHYEMSVLSIGIQLERAAMEFYRGQAEAVTDPEARALFQELADWEQGHYQALLRQQEELTAEYWDAGGFSPF